MAYGFLNPPWRSLRRSGSVPSPKRANTVNTANTARAAKTANTARAAYSQVRAYALKVGSPRGQCPLGCR
eukprot:5381877-Prymnesium_polylepis.1